MRQLSIVATLLFAVACTAVTAPADGRVDTALVGTWQIEGSVMTSSMPKQGAFALRIGADGHYVLASTGTGDFVVDSGTFTSATGGTYVRRTATGLEERGTYATDGGRLRLKGMYAAAEGSRLSSTATDAALKRLGTLLRTSPGTDIAGWTARAAQYAELWQPDARLEYVSMTNLGPDGRFAADTTATIGFFSPQRNQFLTLSPIATTGAMVAFTTPREGRDVSARGIPVPIVDVAWLVKHQRKSGFTGRYVTADLKMYGDSAASARPMWLARPDGNDTFARHCLDAVTAELVDCRSRAGDPVAAIEALGKQAAAAWARLQQRWDGGDTSGGDMGFTPPTMFDRCGGMGGSLSGITCTGSDGREINAF